MRVCEDRRLMWRDDVLAEAGFATAALPSCYIAICVEEKTCLSTMKVRI